MGGAVSSLIFGSLIVTLVGLAAAAPEASVSAKGSTAAPEPGEVRCIYGRLEDGHRGFVRCLSAYEVGAPWIPAPIPLAVYEQAPVIMAEAGRLPDTLVLPPRPAIEAAARQMPTDASLGTISFSTGEVPKAEAALGKALPKLAGCVSDAGGVKKKSILKVQFLVRLAGKAEGVEVLAAKGVPERAFPCLRKTLKGLVVGEPSDDPVGVTVDIELAPRAPTPAVAPAP